MNQRLIPSILLLLFLLSTTAFANQVGDLVEIKNITRDSYGEHFQVNLLDSKRPLTVNMKYDIPYKRVTQVTINEGNRILYHKDRYFGGHWYLAHLRDSNMSELIHFSIQGSGAYLDDLKIFGINDNGKLEVLFDSEVEFRNSGGIKGPELSLDGNKLVMDYVKVKDYHAPKSSWQYDHYRYRIYWSKDMNRFITEWESR